MRPHLAVGLPLSCCPNFSLRHPIPCRKPGTRTSLAQSRPLSSTRMRTSKPMRPSGRKDPTVAVSCRRRHAPRPALARCSSSISSGLTVRARTPLAETRRTRRRGASPGPVGRCRSSGFERYRQPTSPTRRLLVRSSALRRVVFAVRRRSCFELGIPWLPSPSIVGFVGSSEGQRSERTSVSWQGVRGKGPPTQLVHGSNDNCDRPIDLGKMEVCRYGRHR